MFLLFVSIVYRKETKNASLFLRTDPSSKPFPSPYDDDMNDNVKVEIFITCVTNIFGFRLVCSK